MLHAVGENTNHFYFQNHNRQFRFLIIRIITIYSEVFTGPEKRRKRGSLFSRKKKDKPKAKGQSTNCDG